MSTATYDLISFQSYTSYVNTDYKRNTATLGVIRVECHSFTETEVVFCEPP